MKTAGIVLCGGKSSRMGRAKAFLPWGGLCMVAHVIESLRRVVDEVVVVASDAMELPELGDDGVSVVRDREPGLGPLAGIRDGLREVRAELAFVTGTDAPHISPEFVRTMLGFEQAAAPVVDGFVHTMAAVYPRDARDEATSMLAAGRRRPLHLLEAVGYRPVLPHELPGLRSLDGFNTPEDYLAAVRDRHDGATATIEFLGRSRLAMGRPELEVPVGTLAEVLTNARPGLELIDAGRVAPGFLVSLNGRSFVGDLEVPVGPGEQVVVLDAAAGG